MKTPEGTCALAGKLTSSNRYEVCNDEPIPSTLLDKILWTSTFFDRLECASEYSSACNCRNLINDLVDLGADFGPESTRATWPAAARAYLGIPWKPYRSLPAQIVRTMRVFDGFADCEYLLSPEQHKLINVHKVVSATVYILHSWNRTGRKSSVKSAMMPACYFRRMRWAKLHSIWEHIGLGQYPICYKLVRICRSRIRPVFFHCLMRVKGEIMTLQKCF